MADDEHELPPAAARPPMQPLGLVTTGSPVHAELSIAKAPDGRTYVMLRLETASGSWCSPLPIRMARELGVALIDRADIADKPTVVVPMNGLIVPPGT